MSINAGDVLWNNSPSSSKGYLAKILLWPFTRCLTICQNVLESPTNLNKGTNLNDVDIPNNAFEINVRCEQ